MVSQDFSMICTRSSEDFKKERPDDAEVLDVSLQ